MPIADAAESLRWARRAPDLSRTGILDEAEVTFCEDILVELWLLADEPLIDQLAQPQARRAAGAGPAGLPWPRQRAAGSVCRVRRWEANDAELNS